MRGDVVVNPGHEGTHDPLMGLGANAVVVRLAPPLTIETVTAGAGEGVGFGLGVGVGVGADDGADRAVAACRNAERKEQNHR